MSTNQIIHYRVMSNHWAKSLCGGRTTSGLPATSSPNTKKVTCKACLARLPK